MLYHHRSISSVDSDGYSIVGSEFQAMEGGGFEDNKVLRDKSKGFPSSG